MGNDNSSKLGSKPGAATSTKPEAPGETPVPPTTTAAADKPIHRQISVDLQAGDVFFLETDATSASCAGSRNSTIARQVASPAVSYGPKYARARSESPSQVNTADHYGSIRTRDTTCTPLGTAPDVLAAVAKRRRRRPDVQPETTPKQRLSVDFSSDNQQQQPQQQQVLPTVLPSRLTCVVATSSSMSR